MDYGRNVESGHGISGYDCIMHDEICPQYLIREVEVLGGNVADWAVENSLMVGYVHKHFQQVVLRLLCTLVLIFRVHHGDVDIFISDELVLIENSNESNVHHVLLEYRSK